MDMGVIRQRSSVRTYEDLEISEEHRAVLSSLLAKANSEPGAFRSEFRIEDLVMEGSAEVPVKVGTYGVIKGQRGFLVGICDLSRKSLIDLGKALQKVVLGLSSIGIGTCWLGGTFKRSDLSGPIDLEDGEKIAVLISYGYPARKRRLVEGLMKAAAGSKKRKDAEELFFTKGLGPLDADSASFFNNHLEAVRLAPSAMNAQPWRVIVSDTKLSLYLQPPAKAEGRTMNMKYLDMGIAMAHLEAVSKGDSLRYEWDTEGTGTVDHGLEFIAAMVIGD